MDTLKDNISKGQSLTKINNFNKAIEIFETLNGNFKNNVEVLINLAGAYRSIGKFEKSLLTYKKIIEIDPNNCLAHRLVSSLNNYKENNENLKEMEKLILENNINEREKIELSFALGKAYADLEDFEKSHYYYNLGNSAKKKITNFDFSIISDHFNQILNVFKEIDFSKRNKNNNNLKPLFICGLPRSGTTLIEQIISAHKDVYSGGELQFIPIIINKYFLSNYQLSKLKIKEQVENKINRIAFDYNEMYSLHLSSKKILTDKMLQNFKWIGLLKVFFPNCKIIICKRNLKDNFLSIFKNNFNEMTMNWTNDEEDIILYYKYYLELTEFWKEKFSDEIYELEYEKLVNDSKYEIKKLIEYCELNEDKSCYEFYKFNKFPIQTASAFQARKPIYNTSVDLFDKYSNKLIKFSKFLNSNNL